MLLNELTPTQVSVLVDTECTADEKAEMTAAVRQFRESALGCLRRCSGQGAVDGLLLASELQAVRAHFAATVGRIVEAARRRYLDRTLHGEVVPD